MRITFKLSLILLTLAQFPQELISQNLLPVFGKHFIKNWETGMTGEGSYAISTDTEGNVTIVQEFWDSLKLDHTVYYSDSANSSIVIRLDAKGNIIWIIPWVNKAVKFRSNQIINVDPSTNLITGYYYGNFKVNDSIILDSFGSSSSRNSYLIAIDSSSKINWAQSFSNISDLRFRLSPGHEIYFIGKTAQNPDSVSVFGHFVHNNKKFVGKLSKDGKLVFIRSFPNEVSGFCIDNNENIYITGTLGGSSAEIIKIDTVTIKATSQDRSDIFIAKFNKDFNLQWIQRINSISDNDYVNSRNLVTDNNQNLYYAFEYRDSFETGDTIIYGLKNTTKIAIIKFDKNGKTVWIKTTQSNLKDFYEWVSEITFRNGYIKLRASFHPESKFDGYTFHTVEQQQQSIVTMDTNGTISDVLNLELVAAQYAKAPGYAYYQYARLSRNPLTFVKGWEFKPVANVDMLLIKVDTLSWWVGANKAEKVKLTVRPNPVQEVLWVSTPSAALQYAEVYDMSGKLLIKKVFYSLQNNAVDVSSLSKGMYLLCGKDKTGRKYFAKFIRK